ncbi:Vam6/Vps39-like protein [Vitis vinifera]|uniref:Vam6/Vps39-like protein n=1 Tax=Vitis vinifera TaxID=29760 RepID=A0A438EVU0_VITVI|nr:Vam6/Vps39-like protein [Vitis vinifera]
MVHSAYDSFELLNNCPTRIETIESYGAKLFLGCSDGSLQIYGPESFSFDRSPPSDPNALELRKEPYVLERTVTGFSKKPLVAMEVSGTRDLLLSLSESIAFHRLPNLETIAVITKAKGANVYSWDDRRGFLSFARQKRVCIFRHDGGRGFVEVKEFGVPDFVKSMSWCGENICLGIRREYMILNATNGALSEIFPSGRIAPPLVVSLPSGELLLGKDNIGVFVDQNGKLLQEGRICWSEAPKVVVIQKPYAIALLQRHVEIRSLRVPYPLIQTVVLRNMCHLHQSNNAILVAVDNSVYGLFPVPLGAQIVQLTASGDFEEAFALCKMLPPEDASLRAAKEGSIHIRYAHYLFENGSYEEAMDQFFGISNDMESSPPPQLLESEENAVLESKKMSHNTLMALIKFLQKKRYNIIEKATAERTEEVVLDAVGDNFASYDSTRGRVNIAISSGARETAAILDTALLQALLLTGQSSAALELLKSLNYCDMKIYSKSDQPQAELSQKFKPEMIIEYLKIFKNVNDMEALDSLSHLHSKPLCATEPMLVLEFSMLVLESCPSQTIDLFLSGNIPADLVNSYLKQHAPNMQAMYLELMLAMNEHGSLEICRMRWGNGRESLFPTRKKLLSALESISGYNPEGLLKRLPPDALYEERAILLGKMNLHEFALSLYVHKLHVPELALSYCDRVYESVLHQTSGKTSGNIYLTLLQIYLNPRRTTKNFEKRITSLVSSQNTSIPKVSSGTSVKAKGGRLDEPSEEGGSSIMLDEVLDLLSRRWDRIHGAQALKLLPRETKLQLVGEMRTRGEAGVARGGRSCFVVESKSFEILVEELGGKLNSCIWERSKGVSSWIRFGEASLRCLLDGVEACCREGKGQSFGWNSLAVRLRGLGVAPSGCLQVSKGPEDLLRAKGGSKVQWKEKGVELKSYADAVKTSPGRGLNSAPFPELEYVRSWAPQHWDLKGNLRVVVIGRGWSGPLHLWSTEVLKRIGDGCGGFVAADENSFSSFELQLARILAKCVDKEFPSTVHIGGASGKLRWGGWLKEGEEDGGTSCVLCCGS